MEEELCIHNFKYFFFKKKSVLFTEVNVEKRMSFKFGVYVVLCLTIVIFCCCVETKSSSCSPGCPGTLMTLN